MCKTLVLSDARCVFLREIRALDLQCLKKATLGDKARSEVHSPNQTFLIWVNLTWLSPWQTDLITKE
jgi:hypothetical protein